MKNFKKLAYALKDVSTYFLYLYIWSMSTLSTLKESRHDMFVGNIEIWLDYRFNILVGPLILFEDIQSLDTEIFKIMCAMWFRPKKHVCKRSRY